MSLTGTPKTICWGPKTLCVEANLLLPSIFIESALHPSTQEGGFATEEIRDDRNLNIVSSQGMNDSWCWSWTCVAGPGTVAGEFF